MSRNELLAERIASIMIKFNAGETCDINVLAEEFAVNLRTIQRDINVRLAFLPLKKEGSKVSMEPSALGRLTIGDIRNFAAICGVKELFPSLDSSFITIMLSHTFNSTYLIQGHHYEDKATLQPLLTKFGDAIASHTLVNFNYKGKEYENVQPYKLVNSKGIWYLAAIDKDKLKTFHLSKIVNGLKLFQHFEPDTKVNEIIEKEDGIFFSEDKIEVILKASTKVAHYFQRRDLLPNQVIEKELENGELIISSKIAEEIQIIPLVKYWIPELEVISPKSLLKTIHAQCHEFITK
jgi:predicted DNA-binding transcriptional regulator YafY